MIRYPRGIIWKIENRCIWVVCEKSRKKDEQIDSTLGWIETEFTICTTESKELKESVSATIATQHGLNLDEIIMQVWTESLNYELVPQNTALRMIQKISPDAKELPIISGYWKVLTTGASGLGVERWITLCKTN